MADRSTTQNELETFRVTVGDAGAGQRLDRFLADQVSDLSRSRVKALIDAGQVRIAHSGETISEADYRVKPNDHFVLSIPPAEEVDLVPQAMDLDILYEDPDLIVINKPAGLVVHPAPGNPDKTLVNALLAHCGDQLSGIGGERRPGIVHRLDKDTSGVMVAAKSDKAHQGLTALFSEHDIERRYEAVTWGCPLPIDGTIDGNIGRHPKNRKKMAVVDEMRGRDAITHYHVLENFHQIAAHVSCQLETGRTHQIRVHMTHIGHNIIGDPLYGRSKTLKLNRKNDDRVRIVQTFPRQALHAAVLGFIHPVTGETMMFEAELPSDMKNLLKALQGLEI